MQQALINGQILVGRELVSGQALIIEEGRIAAIVSKSDLPRSVEHVDLGGRTLVPGFIDIQVNGGADRLFNDDPSVETILAIGRAHRRFGTTGFLPTLISDNSSKIKAAIDSVRTAIRARLPGVLGVHIEGPFINPAKKGIHDATKLRPISNSETAILIRRTGGKTIVTLAPETVPNDAIRYLSNAGVIVCAGHTNASAKEIFESLRNGVRGFTHLFNAMSQLTAREPGAVGAALYDENSWCGIIVDGHHVDPRVLKIALRATPLRRFMLVSDAMPSVGGHKSFMLNGEKISVVGGKCVNSAGTLAGSDLDMSMAVRNAISLLGVRLPDAIAMASTNPATFLGLDHELGRIAPGFRANLVLLSEDLRVVETWIDGVPTGSLG